MSVAREVPTANADAVPGLWIVTLRGRTRELRSAITCAFDPRRSNNAPSVGASGTLFTPNGDWPDGRAEAERRRELRLRSKFVEQPSIGDSSAMLPSCEPSRAARSSARRAKASDHRGSIADSSRGDEISRTRTRPRLSARVTSAMSAATRCPRIENQHARLARERELSAWPVDRDAARTNAHCRSERAGALFTRPTARPPLEIGLAADQKKAIGANMIAVEGRQATIDRRTRSAVLSICDASRVSRSSARRDIEGERSSPIPHVGIRSAVVEWLMHHEQSVARAFACRFEDLRRLRRGPRIENQYALLARERERSVWPVDRDAPRTNALAQHRDHWRVRPSSLE